MTAHPSLSEIDCITGPARLPGYDPQAFGTGIVHLGLGAFHRAHQAVATDDALAASGGDWRIIGVSLRGTATVDALTPQNGLYTLVERDAAGAHGRVIASIARAIAATRAPDELMACLTAPEIRIVSLTVTEKAYGIDRAARAIDPSHPAVAADLASPRSPAGTVGLLTEGLRRRRDAGTPPFTVLCCDNLPDNGGLLRDGVLDFARRVDPDLSDWIADNVAFPSTMVDRITPAATDRTLRDATDLTGCVDLAAIETEPFFQWVIEDHFPTGRPEWEAGGALFVDDVAPYELMKLRMLNGAHSMLAYAGYLAGCRYVRDVMAHPALERLVQRHFRAAAATLPPVSGIDLDDYAAQLSDRFGNPAIAHETYQIAMDGTEKLPQRILAPAEDAVRKGMDLRPFAFAMAAWMRYATGRAEDGTPYALRDPREDQIRDLIASAGNDAASISDALHGLPGLFPQALSGNRDWREQVENCLSDMLTLGIEKTLAQGAEAYDA